MNEPIESTALRGKINLGDDGLGVASPELVEKRAGELATIDGRSEPNEVDFVSAKAELLGVGVHDLPPETGNVDTESLTGWESLESRGSRVERVLPEDETSAAETLIEEGLEEADHDQRLNAARENPPEEL
jgi:hypothetical protein